MGKEESVNTKMAYDPDWQHGGSGYTDDPMKEAKDAEAKSAMEFVKLHTADVVMGEVNYPNINPEIERRIERIEEKVDLILKELYRPQ